MKNRQSIFEFRLLKKNSNPSIQGKEYPTSQTLVAAGEVYDSEKEMPRKIRIARGESTIFEDEFNSTESSQRVESITFVDGRLFVDYRQKQLLQFLRTIGLNKNSEYKMGNERPIFYEVVPGTDEKEKMQKDRQVMDAKKLAYDLDFETMLSYARVLGIDIKRDPAEIRYALSILAEKDPEQFTKGLNSKNTERANNVLLAVERGILIRDYKNQSIKWGSTGATVVTAPSGQDVIKFFVDWTFGNKEGETTYKAILTYLGVDESKDEEPIQDDIDVKALVEEAIEAGVITKGNGGLLMFGDQRFRKGVVPTSKILEDDEKTIKEILAALGK